MVPPQKHRDFRPLLTGHPHRTGPRPPTGHLRGACHEEACHPAVLHRQPGVHGATQKAGVLRPPTGHRHGAHHKEACHPAVLHKVEVELRADQSPSRAAQRVPQKSKENK